MFLSSHQHKISPLLSATLVGCLLCTSPSILAKTEPAQELKQVKKELRDVNQQLKGAQNKQDKTQASLEKIERDIAERRLRQEKTQSKLAEIQAQATELASKKEVLNAQYLSVMQEVKQLLLATYEMGHQNGLKRLLSQQDPAKISRLAHYSSYVTRSRKALLEQTQMLAAQLASTENELTKRNQQLSKIKLVLEKDQVYLSQLKRNRLASIKLLDGEIAGHSSKAQDLARRESALATLLKDLNQRRANKKKQSRAHENIYSKRSGSKAQQAPTKKFKALSASGTLPLPAKAKLAARFGQKRAETGIPWSGILLRADAGTAINAIAAGEVVYADWLSGYGQLIIIDHGNDLMSLYGHNRALTKAAGDSVQQNELVAYMGDTAGLKSAALYFEIRHRGKPQDPLKWCRA